MAGSNKSEYTPLASILNKAGFGTLAIDHGPAAIFGATSTRLLRRQEVVPVSSTYFPILKLRSPMAACSVPARSPFGDRATRQRWFSLPPLAILK